MEVFKENKVISDWGTVYTGLKRNWLSPNEVIKFCEAKKIVCNNDRLVQLYLAMEDSFFEFLELIKRFVIEDGKPPILINEDSTIQDLSYIPKEYWFFWEIEFLLRIINSTGDKEQKLNQVAAIHSDFNYPTSWHNFLTYMPPPDNVPIGINGLYDNLITYVSNLLKSLKSRH